MSKLRRSQASITDDSSVRLRAAWLYHNHNRTQKEIAELLGLSRTTVMKLLDETLKRGEVQIWINGVDGRCTELAALLEERFGLREAIVVPEVGNAVEAASAVGLALGKFMSGAIVDRMTIGVGWGRTLSASLLSFRPPRRDNVGVVSLLGGIIEARVENPVDYSWRLASQLGADCLLYPAPLLVDSAATKEILLTRCGLDRLRTMSQALDMAVFSVGDIGASGTSLTRSLLTESDHAELVEAGAICDVMCHFLDAEGRSIEHPINERVMSVELDDLAKAGHLVLACGGRSRAPAIRAALKRVGCHTLVTDEGAASELLKPA